MAITFLADKGPSNGHLSPPGSKKFPEPSIALSRSKGPKIAAKTNEDPQWGQNAVPHRHFWKKEFRRFALFYRDSAGPREFLAWRRFPGQASNVGKSFVKPA